MRGTALNISPSAYSNLFSNEYASTKKMMCDFIARTNWSNIKSNYLVNAIIIFNVSHYTNITITVTFVNQPTLCRTFFFFPAKYYLHKSHAIFHINLYILNIHMEVPKSTNKLNHVKQLAIFQNEPSTFPDSRINHLCHYWNKCMLPIVQNTLQLLCLMASSCWWKVHHWQIGCHLHCFFGLGVTNDAAKPDCILPIGDDGSLNEGCSSGKLIVIEINETQLSWKQ